MGSMMMDLIPGLTHDLAVECLLRVPFSKIPSLKLVCKDWKTEMEQPEFYRARKSANKAQSLVILCQCQETEYRDICNYVPPYHLVALEPETGCWWKLPPIPEFEAELPNLCKMVASGSNLVVMGGLDRQSEESVDSVFIFDFLSYKWRRGACMPGRQRFFFGCALDGDGTIYVAGGSDAEDKPQKSAWAYHVSADTWTQLPDMPHKQFFHKGLFHLGKFHIIQGSSMTNLHQSVEIFDISSRQWLMLGSGNHDDKIIKSTKHCAKGADQKLYTQSGNDLVVLEDGKWKFFARLPAHAAARTFNITPFPEHLLLTSYSDDDYPYDTYILDLNGLKRLEVPTEYSGYVKSGCCFTI